MTKRDNEVTVRGWHEERYAPGFDTAGKAIVVVTGLTVDNQGRPVAAMAIGSGPAVVLDGDASQLRANIVSTLADLEDVRRSGR